jgi:hypothetical protein
MNKIKFLPQSKKACLIASGVALSTASGMASADIATAISGAFSAGQTNLGLAAAGVITMVAVLTGIGLIVSMLRK